MTKLKIAISIIGFVGLIMVLVLLVAKLTQANWANIAEWKSVECTLKPVPDSKKCAKLHKLSETLREVDNKITTPQVAYCSVLNMAKLSFMDEQCSNVNIASKLYDELKMLKKAAKVLNESN